MKFTLLIAASLGALVLTGCASTKQFVSMPDQAKRIEDPGKGRIYVMRPATMGAAISMPVSDDGKPIGSTGPHGYLCWERAPGETIISSMSEGVSSVPLSVDAGGVYYLFQHLRMGLVIARSELEIVNEEKGKEVLKHCKAAKVNMPPQPVQTGGFRKD